MDEQEFLKAAQPVCPGVASGFINEPPVAETEEEEVSWFFGCRKRKPSTSKPVEAGVGRTYLHRPKFDWSWVDEAMDKVENSAKGFSGASTVLSTFVLQCKEHGLPPEMCTHLLAALSDLNKVEEVDHEDPHFVGDDAASKILAGVGVMSLKNVVKLDKPRKIAVVQEFMSQDEVLDLFKERIMEDGQLMHKKCPAMIRPGVKGERIVTQVEGRVTSDIVVQDDTSWVVKAPTADQEEYVLDEAKFIANWSSEIKEAPKGDEPNRALVYEKDLEALASQGFRLHQPKLVLKWMYQLQDVDLDCLPTRSLKTEWGGLQDILSGDYLAMPYPETKASEIYIIPSTVINISYGIHNATQFAVEEGSVKLLSSLRFDRRRRGDIPSDTQLLVQALKEPYNLLFRYQMHEPALAKWIQAIAEQYKQVEYHSWTHAVAVFQFIYSSLGRDSHYFQFQDILALLIGALSHDVAHPGLTNNFLITTQAELAIRYNDKSPLEMMHSSVLFETLQKPGFNFLSAMSPDNFRSFRAKVVDSILATDMTHHFTLIDKLSARVLQAKEQGKAFVRYRTCSDESPFAGQPSEPAVSVVSECDNKTLLQAFMHMSDLGHCARPFDIHKHIVVLLEEEFFKQGDQERQLGMPVSPLMDRTKDSAALSQSLFLDKLVLPLMSPWTYFLEEEKARMLLKNLAKNKETWEGMCNEHLSSGAEMMTAKQMVQLSDGQQSY